MSTIKKIVLGIVGVGLFWGAGSIVYEFYLAKETKSQSVQFCDGVTVGEEISAVIPRALTYGPYKVWLHDQNEKPLKGFDQKTFSKLKGEKLTNEVVSVVFRAKVPPTCTCSIKLDQGKVLSKTYSVLD